MRRFLVLTVFIALIGAVAIVAAQQQPARGSAPVPPPWAYGFVGVPGTTEPPETAEPKPPEGQLTLAGSTKSFQANQINNGYGPADWFPEMHPPMPPVVAQGDRQRMINACGNCHLPNGKGRPTNASVSGLSESYFIQTLMDFKNDLRKTSDARKVNVKRMGDFAKGLTDDEIRTIAKYFGSIRWTPWIRVVETDMVPKTHLTGGLYIPNEGATAGMEPIAQRIIEVPEDRVKVDVYRDPRVGYIAYVPKGAVKKGESLAKTAQCTVCHGPSLEGIGPVPAIAGRSASYTMRQLFDMQQGNRKGMWSDLMKPVLAKLSTEDLMNLAAYTASVSVKEQSRAAK
jgi:cytochrome c553